MARIHYAFSLKYNTNGLSPNLLDDIYRYYIYHLKKTVELKFITGCYELDSKGKLHLHAHITVPSKYKYETMKMPGFHAYVKKLTDQVHWYIYMNKNPIKILNSRLMCATSDRFTLFCNAYEVNYQNDLLNTHQKFLSVLADIAQK